MFSRSVRATRRERTRPLPGDELIPIPVGSLTHAITIDRPAREVWPWLAQMGAGSRAGWYSYDFLDNGRRPSATRIVSDLQSIAVGALFPAVPGATDGFHVLWVPLGAVYSVLVTAVGWGVWISAGRSRAVRIVGGLVVAFGALGVLWPFAPMHLRDTLAAGGSTLSDTMHIVLASVTVPLMLLAIGFGERAERLRASAHAGDMRGHRDAAA
jgi:hypothetical protein